MAEKIKLGSARKAARLAGERVSAAQGDTNLLDPRARGLITASTRMPASREEFTQRIVTYWSDAKDRFLRIGQLLIEAKERLEHGEYEAMIERDLPFSRSIAYQLRAVAENVRVGRLQEDEVPPSYSIAYQVTTLKDEELDEARRQGLLAPGRPVQRAEIIRFKTALRAPANQGSSDAEVRRLLAEKERLQQRLTVVEDRLRALGQCDL